MTRGHHVGWVAAIAATLVVAIGHARAMTVLPLDLPALTTQAGRIFVGRVEDVATGRDVNGVPAVWTTFAVDQPIKGLADAPGARVTLKQLGTAFAGGTARVLPHAGLPRFQPGESVVLFVHPESPLGFTSPVGLGQGCFRVHEQDGTPVVENDVGNRNLALAAPAPRAAHIAAADGDAGAALPLATLLTRVRAIIDSTP